MRDVVGDRLFLSKGFRRDGVRPWLIVRFVVSHHPLQTLFDIGQATTLKCVFSLQPEL